MASLVRSGAAGGGRPWPWNTRGMADSYEQTDAEGRRHRVKVIPSSHGLGENETDIIDVQHTIYPPPRPELEFRSVEIPELLWRAIVLEWAEYYAEGQDGWRRPRADEQPVERTGTPRCTCLNLDLAPCPLHGSKGVRSTPPC